jgi:hypothetical protein
MVILLIGQPQNSSAGSTFVPTNALQYRIGNQAGLTLEFEWWVDHSQAAPIEPVGICDVP